MSILSTKFSWQESQVHPYNQEGSQFSESAQRRFTIATMLNYEWTKKSKQQI